jgi:hypothetical protein
MRHHLRDRQGKSNAVARDARAIPSLRGRTEAEHPCLSLSASDSPGEAC